MTDAPLSLLLAERILRLFGVPSSLLSLLSLFLSLYLSLPLSLPSLSLTSLTCSILSVIKDDFSSPRGPEEEEEKDEVEKGKERGGTYVPLNEAEVEVEVAVVVAVGVAEGVSGVARACPLDGGECSWDRIAEKNGVLDI